MELPLGLSQNVNACWSLDGSVIFLYNLDTIYFYEVDVQVPNLFCFLDFHFFLA